MSKKLVVSITHANDNSDKATVGFVVANASIASGVETVVFLSIEGVRLGVKGGADSIHEEGFATLKDLIQQFTDAGGNIFVCTPCFKRRKLEEVNLVPKALLVGGATLVEFLTQGEGAACITY